MKARIFTVIALVITALIGGGLASAAVKSPSAIQSISACTKGGKVINIGKGIACVAGQKRLTWNIRGPVGATGERGAKGEDGAKGEKGVKGDDGARGPQGEKGAKGETGARGPQGPKGDDGKNGTDGKNGADGVVSLAKVYKTESAAAEQGSNLADGTFVRSLACNPGDVLLSGGPANVNPGSTMVESFPTPGPGVKNSWTARIRPATGVVDNFSVVILCATP